MTRWMRVARGSLAAAVSTFVAAFSHAVAGGPLPGAAGLALCLAFSTLVCVALAGKRMSRVRLAASVLVSQALFHGFFGLLTAPTGAAPGGPAAGGSGIHVHSPALDPGALGLAAAPQHASHTDPAMLAAHLVAAVVTFLALRHGELAVCALLSVTRRAVAGILPRLPDAEPAGWPATRVAARVRSTVLPVRRPLLSPMRYRGPPAPLTA